MLTRQLVVLWTAVLLAMITSAIMARHAFEPPLAPSVTVVGELVLLAIGILETLALVRASRWPSSPRRHRRAVALQLVLLGVVAVVAGGWTIWSLLTG